MFGTSADTTAAEPVVSIRGLGKSFGRTRVLQGVDLDVRRGEVVTIIGPSGSGKTTLLRCVNALEVYEEGSIRLDGVEVGYVDAGGGRRRRSERELSPLRAETGMVFQMFYLFPHLTAAQKKDLDAWWKGCSRGEGDAWAGYDHKARELLDLVLHPSAPGAERIQRKQSTPEANTSTPKSLAAD